MKNNNKKQTIFKRKCLKIAEKTQKMNPHKKSYLRSALFERNLYRKKTLIKAVHFSCAGF